MLFRLVVKPLVSQVGIDQAEKLKRLMQSNGETPSGVKSSAVDSQDFKALWLEPLKGMQGQRTILYLPGGGFFFPATKNHTRLLAQLVTDSGCRGMLLTTDWHPNIRSRRVWTMRWPPTGICSTTESLPTRSSWLGTLQEVAWRCRCSCPSGMRGCPCQLQAQSYSTPGVVHLQLLDVVQETEQVARPDVPQQA